MGFQPSFVADSAPLLDAEQGTEVICTTFAPRSEKHKNCSCHGNWEETLDMLSYARLPELQTGEMHLLRPKVLSFPRPAARRTMSKLCP